MSDRHFLDTNVFVYSFDSHAKQKRQRAHELIEAALTTHKGVISSQVVQEFLNVATGKFATPMSLQDCYRYIDSVLSPLCTVFANLSLYKRALLVREETGYSFYDSLIVGAALAAECDVLYSEDLKHGQKVQGLSIVNPFR